MKTRKLTIGVSGIPNSDERRDLAITNWNRFVDKIRRTD